MRALTDKGTIYEEMLQRSASESTKGAGQYFTTRAVIRAMVEVMQPTPQDRICDPAAGTGGFLFTAYNYVLDKYEKELNRDQKQAVRDDLVEGMELSPKVGRMCAMNLEPKRGSLLRRFLGNGKVTDYSARKAIIGSTREARRAGSHDAISATSSRTNDTTMKLNGSAGFTS